MSDINGSTGGEWLSFLLHIAAGAFLYLQSKRQGFLRTPLSARAGWPVAIVLMVGGLWLGIHSIGLVPAGLAATIGWMLGLVFFTFTGFLNRRWLRSDEA